MMIYTRENSENINNNNIDEFLPKMTLNNNIRFQNVNIQVFCFTSFIFCGRVYGLTSMILRRKAMYETIYPTVVHHILLKFAGHFKRWGNLRRFSRTFPIGKVFSCQGYTCQHEDTTYKMGEKIINCTSDNELCTNEISGAINP